MLMKNIDLKLVGPPVLVGRSTTCCMDDGALIGVGYWGLLSVTKWTGT